MTEEQFSRTKLVLKDKNDKLVNSNIAILGVGGVGGYVLEMFARLGIKNITIVDCDVFDESNLNRQILATDNSIGKVKVEVGKERVKNINNSCIVCAKNERISKENVAKILENDFDYVIDAIDDIPAKIEIIKFCNEKNIPLICAMGTGNRYKFPNFVVEDLFKTSYDKLAKKLRNELKKSDFKGNVDVVYTKESVEKTDALGSVVYYPLMCAGTIVNFVVNKIINV